MTCPFSAMQRDVAALRKAAAEQDKTSNGTIKAGISSTNTGSNAPNTSGIGSTDTGSNVPNTGGIGSTDTGSNAPNTGGISSMHTGSNAPNTGGIGSTNTGSNAPNTGGIGSTDTGSNAPNTGGIGSTDTGVNAPNTGGIGSTDTGSHAPNTSVKVTFAQDIPILDKSKRPAGPVSFITLEDGPVVKSVTVGDAGSEPSNSESGEGSPWSRKTSDISITSSLGSEGDIFELPPDRKVDLNGLIEGVGTLMIPAQLFARSAVVLSYARCCSID
ncbi:hypothetical protein ACOMHN_053135 [Nucella lapillus]